MAAKFAIYKISYKPKTSIFLYTTLLKQSRKNGNVKEFKILDRKDFDGGLSIVLSSDNTVGSVQTDILG